MIICVSGIPAVGKSRFCRYLARSHGFDHFDMERCQNGWPEPALHPVWVRSPTEFVAALRMRGRPAAIDWGFPPCAIDRINELRTAGVTMIWFSGDIDAARRNFLLRGDVDVRLFDRQVSAIIEAGLPEALDAMVVRALDVAGQVRPLDALFADVFGA